MTDLNACSACSPCGWTCPRHSAALRAERDAERAFRVEVQEAYRATLAERDELRKNRDWWRAQALESDTHLRAARAALTTNKEPTDDQH